MRSVVLAVPPVVDELAQDGIRGRQAVHDIIRSVRIVTGHQVAATIAEGDIVFVPMRERVFEGMQKLAEQDDLRTFGDARLARRIEQVAQLRAVRIERSGGGVGNAIVSDHHEVIEVARPQVAGGFRSGHRVVIDVLRGGRATMKARCGLTPATRARK